MTTKADAGTNTDLLSKYVDDSPIKYKVRMSNKYLATIYQIQANFGKVKDFDILLTIEGDRVTEVSNRPIMRVSVK